ncbi:hypothetical protein HOT31_gp128 [Microbacterium phage Hendrix]|uniref:Uncharacterized protein n=1 Tax=Microbacterium phage Hendrix TaxID=2182341 RepID=A0A2U8UUF2_9CAUD|nr:hypothetical protein HOT31_gp128 [Microbacterium phage Hendrix]AWN07798.1 hypothetical protein PBI_HENDRIX_127 [Microbacterium phage Hendrix]
MSEPESDSYVAVHNRLNRRRGSARLHSCSADGCDRPALTWAWQRVGPSRTGPARPGRAVVSWGTRIEDYSPMCARHSRQLDHGGTLTHCSRGHERTEQNTNSAGVCARCRADDEADRRRQ